MVLIKHNSLKSDIFFNPIFIPGFSGPESRVQGPDPGARVRVWDPGSGIQVQGPGPGFRSSPKYSLHAGYANQVSILFLA